MNLVKGEGEKQWTVWEKERSLNRVEINEGKDRRVYSTVKKNKKKKKNNKRGRKKGYIKRKNTTLRTEQKDLLTGKKEKTQ